MEHQIFEVGATRANHFSFFNWGANRFFTGGGGEEGNWKWVWMLVVPFRGQNQRSSTFKGVSNLSGLPEN